MTSYSRYAIFAVPDGALYEQGAAWLGWDARTGHMVPHPSAPGLPRSVPELTHAPRKYGFHGTLKAPFRLASGLTKQDLHSALTAFCRHRAPVVVPQLRVARLGQFAALVPSAPCPALQDLAACVVAGLAPCCAQLDAKEMARRRKAKLTPAQDRLLRYWGYPYVFEEFKFHMTLTGRFEMAETRAVEQALQTHFAQTLARPFTVESLCLMGEALDGQFQLLERVALAG